MQPFYIIRLVPAWYICYAVYLTSCTSCCAESLGERPQHLPTSPWPTTTPRSLPSVGRSDVRLDTSTPLQSSQESDSVSSMRQQLAPPTLPDVTTSDLIPINDRSPELPSSVQREECRHSSSLLGLDETPRTSNAANKDGRLITGSKLLKPSGESLQRYDRALRGTDGPCIQPESVSSVRNLNTGIFLSCFVHNFL
jgi:hypothetical protein